jgi:hypothetical protein
VAAVASASSTGTARATPLIEIARWNSPAARGIDSMVVTATAPADWPATVTRPGSPPKPAMFSCTHSSAASQSSTARLAGAPANTANPSAPRR